MEELTTSAKMTLRQTSEFIFLVGMDQGRKRYE